MSTAMSTRSETSHCNRNKAFPALVLLVLGFAVLYVLTAQRGVSWGDSGLFQRRIMDCDLTGSGGLALAHPLYVATAHLVTRFVPVSMQAWLINALSGLWGALAVGGMFACALRLAHSVRAAIIAAVSLGCAHMFWWLSSMSEVYTLSVLLLACEVYCLTTAIQKCSPLPLAVAFLANGVHFSVHNFALLSIPVEVTAAVWLLAKTQAGRRSVAACTLGCGLVAWFAGASPILSLAVGRLSATGSIAATMTDILVGGYGSAVSGESGAPLRVTLFNLALAAMSFTLPCWIAAARNVFFSGCRPRSKPRAEVLFLSAVLLVHFAFWIRYRVSDQATFVLPTLFMAILLASPLFRNVRRPLIWACATLASAIAVPCVATAVMSSSADMLLRSRGELPFRDDLRYFALPWKHDENSAMRFVAAAAKELPPGALLLVDSTVEGPLAAAARLGMLPNGIRLSSTVPDRPLSKTCWEVRPYGAYRISPPEAKVARRGTFYEVILP